MLRAVSLGRGWRAPRVLPRHLSTTTRVRAIIKFKLHDIGEGITEVEMLKWKVTVGQRVDHFDDLCEVQSDKSTPVPGVVHAIKVEEGDMVKVGETLCEIQTEGGEVAEEPSVRLPEEPSVAGGSEHQVEGTERDDLDIAHPEEPSTGVQFTGEASILPVAPPRTMQVSEPVPEREQRDDTVMRRIILASPATRALAGRLGVDLAEVRGTGDKGRVTREDVQRYHERTVRSDTPASGSTRVEFGRTRKVMYRALGAQAGVPHFGYSHTLNLTPLLPFLKALNPTPKDDRPGYLAADMPHELVTIPPQQAGRTTLLSLLIKGLLLAMEEHPIMRARVKSQGDERWLEIKREGIVGVAVSDPTHGLLTPSLPPLPGATSLSDITTQLSALRTNATKPGPPASLVISSVGGLGESTGAMPVIPPGGPLAICAVGRAKWDVEWKLRDAGMKVDPAEVEKAGVQPVLRCPVGWSGDHRVLEGAELIAFTESWKRLVEEPWRWVKMG